MPIVAIVNQKGGVAKTTTTANLGACMAQRNQRTLLIDLDPQANLTLGLHHDWAPLPYGLGEVLLSPETHPLLGILRKIGDMPLYLAPGHMEVARFEAMLLQHSDPAYHLRRALQPAMELGAVDWVFIDCPPSLGLLTQNAIVASTHLLIPAEPKFYSFAGIDTLNKMIVGLSKELQFQISLLGVVLTMVETNTKLHRTIIAEIRERFGEKVFETMIYKNVRLAEAEIEGVPVVVFDPHARSATNYEALAQEILQRLGQ